MIGEIPNKNMKIVEQRGKGGWLGHKTRKHNRPFIHEFKRGDEEGFLWKDF